MTLAINEYAARETSRQFVSEWTTLATGVEVSNLRPATRIEPEIATLRLSANKYTELKQNPRDFLTKYEVFERPLNSASLLMEQEDKHLNGSKGIWYVMAGHNAYCDVYCTAFESPSEWSKAAVTA